jgi:uncharacterized membrane protein YfcA
VFDGLWIFPLLGVAAGILAGLLGIGGGLVLVAALVWLFPGLGVPQASAVHAALATSMAAIIFTGTSSALSHHRRGSVQWKSVRWLVPGMLLGGWLGSLFAQSLQGEVLRWCVAGYCWLAGAQMAFGRTRPALSQDQAPTGWPLTAVGSGIGAVSAVVGIGGGSMTVPYLVWRGVAPVRAVGSSAACGVFIAIAAAAGYALHPPAGTLPAHAIGYVFVPGALGIAAGSVLAAPLGTRIAHAISGPALRRVFAVFMGLVGTSVVL